MSGNPDAPHITAIAGDNITLNCDVNFPNGVASPYVVQWWRKVSISLICIIFHKSGIESYILIFLNTEMLQRPVIKLKNLVI